MPSYVDTREREVLVRLNTSPFSMPILTVVPDIIN